MINNQQKNHILLGALAVLESQLFLNELAEASDDFEIIYGSKYFMKWLGLKDDDYEALQSMPEDIKNKELDKMMRHILNGKQNKKKHF